MSLEITDVVDKVAIWAVSQAFEVGKKVQRQEDQGEILARILP
jgi:hypothetical protein